MTKLNIKQNGLSLKTLETKFKKVLNAMPIVIGQTAVTHFQENITKRQGLAVGGSVQRFQKRVFNNPRSKILNDTGNLTDSIKIINCSQTRVEVGIRKTELPYAEIHQNGGQIPITDKMRKFFWANYYKHASATGRSRGKRSTTTNVEANFWKAMALKRKNATITIPKRQFMDTTPDLQKAILRAIKTEMNQII